MLFRCQRMWREESTGSRAATTSAASASTAGPNLGTLVHKAVEVWVNERDWQSGDPGLQLLERFASIAPTNPKNAGTVRRILSRLPSRGNELAAFFAEDPSATVETEIPLRDSDNYVQGQIDVAAIGNQQVRIVDLKTGRAFRRGNALPEEARYQLAIYAILAESKWHLPWSVYVFTIEEGLRPVTLGPDDARTIIGDLLRLRRVVVESEPVASPSAETCFWCKHRTDCTEHWRAVEAGIVRDAVRGRAIGVQQVDGGMVNLTIDADGSEAVVVRLDEGSVPQLSDGQRVDVFRVRQSDPESPNIWLATPVSAVEAAQG